MHLFAYEFLTISVICNACSIRLTAKPFSPAHSMHICVTSSKQNCKLKIFTLRTALRRQLDFLSTCNNKLSLSVDFVGLV